MKALRSQSNESSKRKGKKQRVPGNLSITNSIAHLLQQPSNAKVGKLKSPHGKHLDAAHWSSVPKTATTKVKP